MLQTILIEDSPTICETLTSALKELANANVIATAGSHLEAVSVLEEYRNQWHLLVVDLFLQQGSGMDVLCQAFQRSAGQSVVVLTNYATPDVRLRCAELGADKVFDKSTELEEFFAFCSDTSGVHNRRSGASNACRGA